MSRSRGKSSGLQIYIVVMILGLCMTLLSAGDAITLFTKENQNISSKKITDFNDGEMVYGNVEYVFDVVATMETQHTIYGIPYKTDNTPFYLVYVNYDSEGANGFYVIFHATNENTISAMDNLMNATQNLILYGDEASTSPLSINTKTKAMQSEVKEYLYEYFEEGDMSKEECDEITVTSLMLEELNYTQAKLLPLIGIGIMVIATIIFIVLKVHKKSNTTYVNEIPSSSQLNNYNNSVPIPTDSKPAKRYYTDDSNQNNSGEMDSINPDDYFK